jgi:Ner family transcriptional regulator
MHPADVIAALRKRGTSLRQLAIHNKYSHIQRVLTSPWLAAEQLVAQALGVSPEEIWPSRYLNPASRELAFRQTRKIAVTMPRAGRQSAPASGDPPRRAKSIARRASDAA